MGSAAQFSGPAVTPDLAYTEIMFIRSLADRNRAPRAVKLVTVGAGPDRICSIACSIVSSAVVSVAPARL